MHTISLLPPLPQKRICSQPKTDPIIPGNREMFFTQKLEQEILFFLFMTQIPPVHLLSGQKFQKDFKRNIRYIPWIFWGCGLSDKPGLSYTNYMYVQLITAFIKDIIKSKTSVVASNLSSSFVIMANQLDASIIDKMIFINPVSFHSMDAMPDQQSKLKQTIINLPLVGTFIYNLLMNPKRIDRQFRFIYYCRPQLISSKTKDAYYEAAHMDNSNGKYLYSSLLGNYMNIDLRHAVKKITKPVSFIISSDIKANYKTAQEYCKLNSNIDITYVSNCKLYPQLENPEKVYQIIENKLSN